ncbi:hypothetical protein [Aggregatilinea lenta]|uniref:hypothetical protein n=1 Tax=Aggregatilinea lenta TaxID=913108 RepID=UPI0013C2BFC3|nr:hypothetical protein [Aggregatilinea lenta]
MATRAATLEQTGTSLERRVRRWDRRLRLVQSVVWLPRGLIAGLVVALAIAAAARLRVWLLPDDVAALAVAVIGVSGLVALIAVWVRPQPVPRLARQFDRRFGLKDRVSTALELAGGSIPSVEYLTDYQLDDAMRAAAGVDVAALLPVRVRWRELVLLAALGAVLAYLLLAPNPRADELRAQQALHKALAVQTATLDAAIEDIEQDPRLTEAEKDALTQPLEEARDTLNQPGVTQPEAVAALAQAGQSLQELSNGMLPDQQQAYSEAAQALSGSSLTQPLSDALGAPDLQSAAQEAESMSDRLGETEISDAEREDLANRLDEAAGALEANNPALAEQMRRAADALRQGDMGAAQQALSEAAQTLQEQQRQLDQSPLAEQADSAQQQAAEGQQQLAQTGQNGEQAQASQGQPGGQQNGQQQSGEQASQGQEAQNGEGASQGQTGAQPQDSQGQGQSGDQQSGEPSAGEGESGEGQSQSGAENAGEGDQGAQQGAAQPGASMGEGESSALSAGQGEGGAGNDTTSGVQQDGAVQADGASGDGNGEPGEFESPYQPSTIGGQSDESVDVGGEVTDPNAVPLQEGDLASNPSGEAQLSYQDVYGDYQGAVSDAQNSPRIPLGQRDVIHDYFSALEP